MHTLSPAKASIALEQDRPVEAAARAERAADMDIAKALLIGLVILGHGIQKIAYAGREDYWSDPLFKCIYMFHMPLFMAYSGYFSPQRALKFNDILKRAKSLLYPMIPWSIIAGLSFGLTQGHLADAPKQALQIFAHNYWFLWSLLVIFTIVWIDEKAGQFALPVQIAAFLALVAMQTLIGKIWLFPYVTFMFPFFMAGRLYRKFGQKLSKFKRLILAVAASAVVAASYLFWRDQTYIYVNFSNLRPYWLDVIVMYVGSAAAAIVAAEVFHFVSRRLARTPIAGGLQMTGTVTLEIYLIHPIVFDALATFTPYFHKATATSYVLGLAITVIVAIALLILSTLFIAFTRRIRPVSLILWGKAA